jgi:hypothetical protein
VRLQPLLQLQFEQLFATAAIVRPPGVPAAGPAGPAAPGLLLIATATVQPILVRDPEEALGPARALRVLQPEHSSPLCQSDGFSPSLQLLSISPFAG